METLVARLWMLCPRSGLLDNQIHSASFLSFIHTLAMGDVIHRSTLDTHVTLLDFPASTTMISVKPYKPRCLWQKTVDNGFKDFKRNVESALRQSLTCVCSTDGDGWHYIDQCSSTMLIIKTYGMVRLLENLIRSLNLQGRSGCW